MLKVSNLSKKYKGNDFYSLKDVSFTINKGEIIGLIGRNGAGKTTLLRMMTKATKPSKGTIEYNDINIDSKNNVLDSFGIMIKPVFYNQLSVYENLVTYLQIHNKLQFKENIQPTLELVDLWDSKDRLPGAFSFGMKQRLALAISLVAEPSVLILDEPFVGLDPVGVKQLLDILKEWSENRKVSMIISSHQLSELKDICDKYIFIKDGHLEDQFGQKKNSIIIEINDNIPVNSIDKLLTENISFDNRKLIIPDNLDNIKLNKILLELSKLNAVKSISTNNDDLKNLF